MQIWRVTPNSDSEQRGTLAGPLTDVPCAMGRSGTIPEAEKREGDGKTPLGTYMFRQVFYRPDKMEKPTTRLPTTPLSTGLGWCDDPRRIEYNRLVHLPFSGSHEKLWRDDALYDLILVISHNDQPPVAGMGSAIFIHVATEQFRPTEGCIALAQPALLSVLRMIRPDDRLHVGWL